MRVTVRRSDERADVPLASVAVPTAPVHEEPEGATEPLASDVIRIESPMVGTSTAPRAGAAFVEEGDTVESVRRSASSRR